MMRKERSKANGEGTIYKEERNGKTYYRGLLTIGRNEDGKLIRKSFSSTKKQDVIKKIAEYKVKSDTNTLSTNEKITLEKWFYIWLFEFRVNDLKPSSFERYEGIYRNYIKGSKIGKKTLVNLRTADIQIYYNYLLETGKTPNTIKTLDKSLKTCLGEALNQNYIVKNICSNVTLPKIAKNEEVEIFSLEEQKVFLNSLEGHRLKALFVYALGTGLRQGELLALKWADIDDISNTVFVNKSIKRVSKISKDNIRASIIIEQTPKTKNSIRTIPVPTNVMKELSIHKENQEAEKTKNVDFYINYEYVFATELGMPIDSRNLNKIYTKLLIKAELNHKKFHSLRHTYCTRLFEADIAIKTVQKLMGHSDIATTMNIYTHVMPEKMAEGVEKINNLF